MKKENSAPTTTLNVRSKIKQCISKFPDGGHQSGAQGKFVEDEMWVSIRGS
jgi:hypothetical protein